MKIDLLTPTQLQYPGMAGTCQQGSTAVVGGGGLQTAQRDGLFNSIFTPDDLPYPLPILQSGGGQCAPTTTPPVPVPVTPPAATPPAVTPPATPPAAATPCPENPAPSVPQQIIINVTAPAAAPAWTPPVSTPPTTPPTSSNTTSPTTSGTSAAPVAPLAAGAPVAAVAPVIAAPPAPPITTMPVIGSNPPSDTFVQAYAYNPRLRSRQPKAQEQLLEQWLEEQISFRMLSAQSAPVAFVVPDGFNAVDFYLGAIELNPDIGEHGDLDLIITLGDVKLSANAQPGAGSLKPGDQITVVVPWRYASWTELSPEHLRVPVFARFYTIENF